MRISTEVAISAAAEALSPFVSDLTSRLADLDQIWSTQARLFTVKARTTIATTLHWERALVTVSLLFSHQRSFFSFLSSIHFVFPYCQKFAIVPVKLHRLHGFGLLPLALISSDLPSSRDHLRFHLSNRNHTTSFRTNRHDTTAGQSHLLIKPLARLNTCFCASIRQRSRWIANLALLAIHQTNIDRLLYIPIQTARFSKITSIFSTKNVETETPRRRKMTLSSKSLAGPGYIILNGVRVMNIIGFLAVIAASVVMLVKTSVSSKFFFFDAVTHVLTAVTSSKYWPDSIMMFDLANKAHSVLVGFRIFSLPQLLRAQLAPA